MRSVKSFIYTLLGIVLFVVVPVFLIISNHIGKSMPGNDHTIMGVTGNATVQYTVDHLLDPESKISDIYRKKSEQIPLREGMQIGSGARIQSEKGGAVDLNLNKEVALRIKENSLLKIENAAVGSHTAELSLERGKILCHVNSKNALRVSPKIDLLRISTPTAVSAVTDTASFVLHYFPEKKSAQIQVTEGAVAMTPIKQSDLIFQVTNGKKLRIDPSLSGLHLRDIPSPGPAELLEVKKLHNKKPFRDGWNQFAALFMESPLYKKILVEITKCEMKIFIRAIIHFAPLRWGNMVPLSLKAVELDDGDYKDSWNTDYFYETIGSKHAVLISAGPDKILHTLDDILMHIKL